MAETHSPTSAAFLFGTASVPAPTGAEAAAFDAAAIRDVGIPQTTLMENAGRSAALVLDRLYPTGAIVAVVGGGNNGGDALVALRTLAGWGREVRALQGAPREDMSLLHGWPLDWAGNTPDDWVRVLGGATVILDGLLGTGISGPPRPKSADAIRAMNEAPAPVVALDVPSGLDATTGQVAGSAVQAELTIAFGWPKIGTLLPPGRGYAGRIVAVEIGFPPVEEGRFGQAVITPAWSHRTQPRRDAETHKYAAGTLLLVAGRPGMAGAAVMAARAAQRAGIGLLTVASFPENREVLQTTAPEAIFVDVTSPTAMDEAIQNAGAIAVGPGLGTGAPAAQIVRRILGAVAESPLVVDADALTLSGAGDSGELAEAAQHRPVVLTPHLGELERITDFTRDDVRSNRVAVARASAAQLNATVVLKGIPSVVSDPAGAVKVDVVGTSDLATGGMGDVLTGVIGSFAAQGAAPADAASLGLYFSGRAAMLADKGIGLIPEDVIEKLPTALAEGGAGATDLPFGFVVFDSGR